MEKIHWIVNNLYKGVVVYEHLQHIQVEHLTVSVVLFIVMVELIALQGKMTDIARREWQCSVWENRNMLFPR